MVVMVQELWLAGSRAWLGEDGLWTSVLRRSWRRGSRQHRRPHHLGTPGPRTFPDPALCPL